MLPDRKLIDNFEKVYEIAKNNNTYLIADLNDGMEKREIVLKDFLKYCGVLINTVEVKNVIIEAKMKSFFISMYI